MPLIEIFAANLRYYRKKKGFSQEALADACGLHRTYIGSVERAERNISLQNVERISVALGISPEFLIMEMK